MIPFPQQYETVVGAQAAEIGPPPLVTVIKLGIVMVSAPPQAEAPLAINRTV